MEWSVILCEDEQAVCDALARDILACFEGMHVRITLRQFYDSRRLLEALPSLEVHVCFLDIDMPGLDGISLAQQLRERFPHVVVLFVSNREELVFQSFMASPLRFLRKNRFREELPEAVKAVLGKLEEERHLELSSEGKEIWVPIHGILYVESFGRKQVVHLKDREIQVQRSMDYFCQTLEDSGFLRVHKSYLVNYRFIYAIRRQSVSLTNGEEIPMSKYRVGEVTALYHRLIR